MFVLECKQVLQEIEYKMADNRTPNNFHRISKNFNKICMLTLSNIIGF